MSKELLNKLPAFSHQLSAISFEKEEMKKFVVIDVTAAIKKPIADG